MNDGLAGCFAMVDEVALKRTNNIYAVLVRGNLCLEKKMLNIGVVFIV